MLGAENRVYMEAFTPYGDPADISVELVESATDTVVATLSTAHEGLL